MLVILWRTYSSDGGGGIIQAKGSGEADADKDADAQDENAPDEANNGGDDNIGSVVVGTNDHVVVDARASHIYRQEKARASDEP